MAPKVPVSDTLFPAAIQIFQNRGIEVDFQPNHGKDKNRLFEVINPYAGLAIRSTTRVTEKILQAANNLKVVGRAGKGIYSIDRDAVSKGEQLL